MTRLTITLDDRTETIIEEKSGDDGPYESKSEAVRKLIQAGEDSEERVQELEETVERLRNEKAVLVERHQESKELVRYGEERRVFTETTLTERLRWFLTGRGP